MFDLSSREEEVLKLISEGLSNREISKKLFIGKRTTASHIDKIYQKLGLSGLNRSSIRVKAVLIYLENVNKK